MTHYEDIVEILFYFSEKVNKARSLGINLIIDPGFGFENNRAEL
jgi:dihydropteroate synthase